MHHAFWYISLLSLPDYDVKLLNFTFCGGGERTTMTFFFFSCTSTQSLRIQVHKKIANIWRIERNGISAIKFKAARLHFLSDVFAAAAVVVAIRSLKVPDIKRFLAAKLPLFQANTNFEICHAATKIAKNWRNRRFCWHWKIQVLEGVEGGPIKSTISAIFTIFLKLAKTWRNRKIS